MARLLTGSLEHEEILRQVVPHLLERCPHCRELRGVIERLRRKVGHWSEEVAVFEGLEAPKLWCRLEDLPYEEQVRKIDAEEDLHTWGFCQQLLTQSRRAVFDDPGRAAQLANLALRVHRRLGDAYHPDWLLDLRARCHAHLGNARRVLGELRSADDAFRQAADCLARGGTGEPRVRAEIVDLEISLRRAQRRLDEALEKADVALALYREAEDAHGGVKVELKKAKILEEMGELQAAVDLLTQVVGEIDVEKDARLFAYARFNLVWALLQVGELAGADLLLTELRPSFREVAKPLDLVRLRWMEGNIDLGLGRVGPAEAAFREVQREFLDRGMGYDAALVSLDLAILYAQEGALEALRRLAIEVMPVFAARDVHREALVALLLFQRACEEDRLTAEMARQIALQLRRERGRTGGGDCGG
jgi:tetratricopeptide (TPR) repeat protein